MNKDLRYYLEYIRKKCPSELLEVEKEVDPTWEVAAVLRKLQSQNLFPAVLFKKVIGSTMPILTNLFASRVRLACAIETTLERLHEEYIRRSKTKHGTKMVNSGPVKEIVMKNPDLSKLPIVTHCEKDAGPYITAGVTLMKDKESGAYNAGIYRMMYKDPRTLVVQIAPTSDADHIFQNSEERGEDLEAAIVIGHHPAVALGSQNMTPLGVDELEVIGGILGEPLEIVECETVDLCVPAQSEIVIEGKFKAGERGTEAPFGEFAYYYGVKREDSKVFEVTAITHRKDAIYHDVFNAHIDHTYCGMLGREAALYGRVKELFPELVAVRMPESGACRFTAYLQIKKGYEGIGKNIALSALTSPTLKIAIVVDDDVDIYSDKDVLWAIATRTHPDKAFFFIPETFVCRLDPSSYSIKSRLEIGGGINTKVGIDATKPIETPFPERADVAKDNWLKIKLKDYFKEI